MSYISEYIKVLTFKTIYINLISTRLIFHNEVFEKVKLNVKVCGILIYTSSCNRNWNLLFEISGIIYLTNFTNILKFEELYEGQDKNRFVLKK